MLLQAQPKSVVLKPVIKVNNVHRRWHGFAYSDLCMQAAEALESFDDKLGEVLDAVNDQSLDSLRALRKALTSHVATFSDAIERVERAEQRAQLDPDNVCYIKTKFFAICSILDSNFE